MALSDIDLVTLAKAAKDDAAFAELVRRHQAGLRAFLRRFAPDASSADDLAQEAFVKAHAGIRRFRGGASFRSWLYAIAWREMLQAQRRDGARRRLAAAIGDDRTDAGAAAPELSIDLQRALAALEENERAAVLLCDAAGLSHGEAAAALGAPLGSVKTFVARAREKMRAVLAAPPREVASASKGAVHVV